MVKKLLGGALALLLLGLALAAVSVVRLDRTKEELAAKYTTPASQFLALPDGAIVHVRDEGVREGPALVLLHGSNASLQTWEPWVAALGTRYRVISMDLPGHGLTGAVPGDDYSRAGMTAFVRETMQALGVRRFALAGNSMGGGIAAEYAERFPDEVSALIHVDAAGIPRHDMGNGRIPLGFRIARMPVLSWIFRYVTPRAVFAEGLRKVFVDQSMVTEAMIDRYYDLALYDGNRRATMLRFQTPNSDEATAARLGEIKAPTLILWGEKDTLIPVSQAYEFKRRIAGSKLIIYPDTGHIPMEEVAERSAADVTAFLQMAIMVPSVSEGGAAAVPSGLPSPATTVPALKGKGAVEVAPIGRP